MSYLLINPHLQTTRIFYFPNILKLQSSSFKLSIFTDYFGIEECRNPICASISQVRRNLKRFISLIPYFSKCSSIHLMPFPLSDGSIIRLLLPSREETEIRMIRRREEITRFKPRLRGKVKRIC